MLPLSPARGAAFGAAALLALLAAPTAPLAAQESLADRLSIHAALNAGYGRADDRGTLGIPEQGTSDYRTFTLQFRTKLTERDEVVAQVFNRRIGASPLAGAIGDVTMQWAYWQHTRGDLQVKLGRNPFPRGLLNEVRYIGTVQPFFRPPIELTREAFDAIDGAVVTYRKQLPGGFRLEQHAFAGGSENRSVNTTSTGTQIRIARTENQFGAQTFLYVPVANVKLGAWGSRYGFRQSTGNGYRTSWIVSAQGEQGPVKLWAEQGRIYGYGPDNDSRKGYVMTQVRLTDRVSLGGQRSWLDRTLFFPNAAFNRILDETRNWGASVIWSVSPNAQLKLEHHWRSGYDFDVPIAPVLTQPPALALRAPGSTRYFIASVAVAF